MNCDMIIATILLLFKMNCDKLDISQVLLKGHLWGKTIYSNFWACLFIILVKVPGFFFKHTKINSETFLKTQTKL